MSRTPARLGVCARISRFYISSAAGILIPQSKFLGPNETRVMTIEQAIAHSLSKPWGVVDPRPWSSAGRADHAIGEIWYERSGSAAVAPSLLLELLFTNQPLSIQVHSGAAYAQSIGLPSVKTEARY